MFIRAQVTLDVAEFHYYYKDTSTNINLNSTYCSSQTGYNCTIGPDNTTVTTDVSPDPPTDRPITVTWEAEEINSGAFRQDNNNGDHEIECYAVRTVVTRTSTVTIEGICVMLSIFTSMLSSSIIISN